MTNLPLPRLDPDQPDFKESLLASASWLSAQQIIEALAYNENDPESRSPILLGQIRKGRNRQLIGFDDDRHMTTIAGSRAGKGDSLIIPNLLTYKGSVICIDPKGENASVTAQWRAEKLGQKVYVIDPFRVAKVPAQLRKTFNPLDYLDPDSLEIIEDAGALADAMIVPTSPKDAHWDESAREFLQGLILHILSEACHE